jgi:DNA helicase HerA-like ATPase
LTNGSEIFVGGGEREHRLLGRYANRHGLITGATGTGKTVTLQVLAEGFSAVEVPVFAADVKGDLSGLSQAGEAKSKIVEREQELGLGDRTYRGSPAIFWDLFAEQGHPVRATISDMGPLLLGRLLDLNEVQAGVLNIVFQVADDEGLLLIDLKDLRAMLVFVADHASDIREEYGNVSSASVGAIQRGLLTLEQQGGNLFFGEPALELEDLMLNAPDGSGAVNILAADRLMQSPRLYSTFLLWLLAELFENLPEVGDSDKPKLVFFFDEAHLLFDDAPKALVDKVEQVVRLIRSKGVGVYFVTQNPQDIPDDVLGQLGNRVQHALRAYTPRDQKAVRAAAETFRPNPALDTEAVITELGVGEALISFLEEDGVPAIVDRALVAPPLSRIGPASKGERAAILAGSPLGGVYDEAVDRESAYEKLRGQAGAEAMEPGDSGTWRRPGGKERRNSPWRGEDTETMPTKSPAKPPKRRSTRAPKREKGMVEKVLMGDGRRQGLAEAMAKSAVRTVGRQIGRSLVRGILGSLFKG